MTSYVRTVTIRRWGSIVSALLAVSAALAMTLTVAAVGLRPRPGANPIVCENQLDGTPREPMGKNDGIGEARGDTIQGYATEMSVNRGRRSVQGQAPRRPTRSISTGSVGTTATARGSVGNIPKTAAQDQISRKQPSCMT